MLFFFIEPILDNVQSYIAYTASSSSTVCRISKSDRFHSSTLNSILELNGGSDELNIEEQKKLIKSVLSKVSLTSSQEISINKFLIKIADRIEPIVTNQKLWQILHEFEKPMKSAKFISFTL